MENIRKVLHKRLDELFEQLENLNENKELGKEKEIKPLSEVCTN